MKRLISLVLALVLCVSLVACGKKASVASLLECPAGSSAEELEQFLKGCGYTIESVTNDTVIFTHGEWRGMANALAISLSISMNPKQETLDAMYNEIREICGEPYNTQNSNFAGMESTMEFYTDGNSIIVWSVSSGMMSSADVAIYPGAAG